MIILMLGKPGSGKGTQAELLSKRLKLPLVSIGSMLRNIESKNTPLAKKIKKYIDRGSLAPDDLVLDIVKKKISGSRYKKGFIFDGFPRDLYQAKKLEHFANPDAVFYLEVPEKLVIKRLSNRYESECGETYNLITNPPKKDIMCDRCGKKLYRRKDDNPSAIKRRFRIFNKQTMPVVRFYKSKGNLIRIDGSQKIEKAQSEMLRKLRTRS